LDQLGDGHEIIQQEALKHIFSLLKVIGLGHGLKDCGKLTAQKPVVVLEHWAPWPRFW
jgi:hypothetical protein